MSRSRGSGRGLLLRYFGDNSGIQTSCSRTVEPHAGAGDTDEQFCGSYKMFCPDGTFMPHELCPTTDVLSGKIPEARNMEVHIERPDGSRLVVIVNILPFRNERGEITQGTESNSR
jgi:hypothetical protein